MRRWKAFATLVAQLGLFEFACSGKPGTTDPAKADSSPVTATDAAGAPTPADAAAGRDLGVDRAADAPRPDAPYADAGRDGRADGPTSNPVIDAPIGEPPPPGTLALGARCETPAGQLLGCAPGLLCCRPCCDGRFATCQNPVANAAGIGVGQCPLPDLSVSVRALQDALGAGPMTFTPMSCEAQEMCVEAPGRRNTLHFEVLTPNVGTSDLVLGDPERQPGFTFASCHDHYHYEGYALYQLLDASGAEVMAGRKRAFCLQDSDPAQGYPLTRRARALYDCDRQGISAGWADSYYNGLNCQYLDVTGVPAGRYTLRVTVNPDKKFPELSYANNVAETQVDVPVTTTSPMEACAGQVSGISRECSWRQGTSQACTPGARLTVGCGAECGLGTATGDPMLRICPGNEACAHPGLGNNDDCPGNRESVGSLVRFTCPASGRFTVMTAPSQSDRTAQCNFAIR